jgi:hypothetical protein
MAENNDPPRRLQPLLDSLRIIKAWSPLWRAQQEAIAKLRGRLALPPALAEALREVKEEAARLDAEAKAEASANLPAPGPAAEAKPAVAAELAAEPAVEPAIEATPSEPVADEAVKPAAPIKRKPRKQWSADWRQTHPQGKDEGPGEYAQRMCAEMATAPDVTEPWDFETCRRELYRKAKEVDFEPDPGSVQTFPKPH